MKNETLVKASAQGAKLSAGLTLFLLGGISLLVSAFAPRVHDTTGLFEVLFFVGAALFLAGGAIVTRGIRCPSCGCPFIWREIRTMNVGEWVDRAFQTTTCPECGFHGHGAFDHKVRSDSFSYEQADDK